MSLRTYISKRINGLKIYLAVTNGNGIGCIMSLLLAFAFVGGATVLRKDQVSRQRGTPVAAVVTGFGKSWRGFTGPQRYISAKDKDGFVGTEFIGFDDFQGCKIGDTIKALRLGTMLRLIPGSCPIHQ